MDIKRERREAPKDFAIKAAILINRFFEDNGIPVEKINNGHCYHWAYIMHLIAGGSIYSNMSHAAIRLYGTWYDAEEPFGCDDKKMWPAWDAKPKQVKDINFFQNYWDEHGRFGWDENLCQTIVSLYINEKRKDQEFRPICS